MTELLDTYKHRGQRKALVSLLASKGITDSAVLKAIESVPRHFFFEKAFYEHAYQDKAFPIGDGQTISQPYTVAFQSQLLEVQEKDKVLEIGTGSGYQCAVLMEMGAKVYTIEYVRNLHMKARTMLAKMGYTPYYKCGDGTLGWPSVAPFDKIIVTAGAPKIPSSLIDQLKVGGMLVIPVGDESNQTMVRLTKTNEKQLKKEEFDGFKFVPLVGKDGWKNV